MSIAIISVGATFGYVFVTSPSVVFTNQRSLFRPQLVFFQTFLPFNDFIFVFILEDGGKANAFFSVTKLPIDTRNVIETGAIQGRAEGQIGQDQNGEKFSHLALRRFTFLFILNFSLFCSSCFCFSAYSAWFLEWQLFYVLAVLHLGRRAGKVSWVEMKLRLKFHSVLLILLFWFLSTRRFDEFF